MYVCMHVLMHACTCVWMYACTCKAGKAFFEGGSKYPLSAQTGSEAWDFHPKPEAVPDTSGIDVPERRTHAMLRE